MLQNAICQLRHPFIHTIHQDHLHAYGRHLFIYAFEFDDDYHDNIKITDICEN